MATRPTTQATPARRLWQKGKWFLMAGGVAGAIALLVALTSALPGPEAKVTLAPVPFPTPQVSGGTVSTSLPNFALALYQGADILGSQQPRFHDLLGQQPVVLNFWASSCPPCAAEIPEFEKVWRKYKDRVLFFGLDVGQFADLGGPEDSRRELRSLGVTYPAAPAPDIAAVQALQVRALPSTYFIARDGAVSKQWVGILNEKKLTELVEGLLNGSRGAPPKSKLEFGTAVSILPALHSLPYVYNTRPPTSGNHLAELGPYGLRNTPLDAKLVVHNMEHGGVVVWYQPDDPDLAEQVRTLLGGLGSRCLVAGPYSDMDYKIAVTAWGRLLGLGNFDAAAISAFVTAYRGELGPEALDPRVGCKVYPP